MKKNKENKNAENLSSEEKKAVDSLIDSLDDNDTAPAEKFKRWEADRERAALFEEEEKRPVLSVAGLLLGLLCWIALFALPKPGFDNLDTQLYLMLAVTLGAFLMSFFGRRRAFGMSVIGMLVSGGLMLFLIIALIVVYVTK
ncbi:MAG: hypothetical protein K2L55_00185 [Muribaculaceae bacterium]|nr:hypothetical protein [Muribaculaceae bacterium]